MINIHILSTNGATLAINIPAVTDFDNLNYQSLIQNRIYHPVAANSNAPGLTRDTRPYNKYQMKNDPLGRFE